MAKFPTVRETNEILQKNPESLKVFGRTILLCLAGLEQEIVGLKRSMTKLAEIVVAMTEASGEEKLPPPPGGAEAAADEDEGSLRPNVAGTGAVNPQPIVTQAPPMPPQKNGSQVAQPVAPPIATPIVTPNAPAAKQ